jgi:hypothetical protein
LQANMKPGLISQTLCTAQTGLEYMLTIYLNRISCMPCFFLPRSTHIVHDACASTCIVVACPHIGHEIRDGNSFEKKWKNHPSRYHTILYVHNALVVVAFSSLQKPPCLPASGCSTHMEQPPRRSFRSSSNKPCSNTTTGAHDPQLEAAGPKETKTNWGEAHSPGVSAARLE